MTLPQVYIAKELATARRVQKHRFQQHMGETRHLANSTFVLEVGFIDKLELTKTPLPRDVDILHISDSLAYA